MEFYIGLADFKGDCEENFIASMVIQKTTKEVSNKIIKKLGLNFKKNSNEIYPRLF